MGKPAEGGGDGENPAYVGAAHRAFCYDGPILKNLQLSKEVSLDQIADRRDLLRGFDTLQRDLDVRGQIGCLYRAGPGLDHFSRVQSP